MIGLREALDGVVVLPGDPSLGHSSHLYRLPGGAGGAVRCLVADGLGNTEIADTLNGRGERSVRGGQFTATSIRRLRARLAARFV